jgi:hypothetical protein
MKYTAGISSKVHIKVDIATCIGKPLLDSPMQKSYDSNTTGAVQMLQPPTMRDYDGVAMMT